MLGHGLNALAHALWPWPASRRDLWTSPDQECSESLQGHFGSPWTVGGRACPDCLVRKSQGGRRCLRTTAWAPRTLAPCLSHPGVQKVERAGGSGQGRQPGLSMRVMPSGSSQLMCALSWPWKTQTGGVVQLLQGSCSRWDALLHVTAPFLTPWKLLAEVCSSHHSTGTFSKTSLSRGQLSRLYCISFLMELFSFSYLYKYPYLRW